VVSPRHAPYGHSNPDLRTRFFFWCAGGGGEVFKEKKSARNAGARNSLVTYFGP